MLFRSLVLTQQHSPIVEGLVDSLQLQGLDTDKQVRFIWGWVKNHVRYVEDDVLLGRAGIDPYDKELLHEPALMVQQVLTRGYTEGDCDDFVTLFATLVAAANDRAGLSFVTIKTADQGDIWAHVYLYIYCPCGKRIVVDSSHGPMLGWELPNPTELQEWVVRGIKPKTEVERNREMLLADNSQMGMAGYTGIQQLPNTAGVAGVAGLWSNGDWAGETGNGSPASGGGVDWGSILTTTINTGINTASDIFKWQYGAPPPNTAIVKDRKSVV